MRAKSAVFISMLAATVGACASSGNTVSLPDTASLSTPQNLEAAEMTADFVNLAQQKLPLLDRLAVIINRDWYVRGVFIPQFSNPDLDAEVRAQFQKHGGEYVTLIDTLNTLNLKAVLEDYSWGDIIQDDPILFERVFPIVQHSPDLAFRAEVLEEIRPFAEQGLIDKALYATMLDRVRLSQGKDQIYGTQFKCVSGQYETYQLAEPATVDQRRAEMGLGPLVEYLEQGRKIYGPCGDG
jgi:hypothetical protein